MSHLRLASHSDIPEIVSIYNHYITLPNDVTTFEEDLVSESEMLDRYNAIVTSGNFFVVIQSSPDATDILGYAYSRPYNSRPCYRFTSETSIYLRPGFGSRGYGQKLMRHLLKLLKEEKGVKQVIGVIGTEEDNPGSYKLHVKTLGYRVVGTFSKVGWKHNKWVDRVHVQKDLEEASD